MNLSNSYVDKCLISPANLVIYSSSSTSSWSRYVIYSSSSTSSWSRYVILLEFQHQLLVQICHLLEFQHQLLVQICHLLEFQHQLLVQITKVHLPVPAPAPGPDMSSTRVPAPAPGPDMSSTRVKHQFLVQICHLLEFQHQLPGPDMSSTRVLAPAPGPETPLVTYDCYKPDIEKDPVSTDPVRYVVKTDIPPFKMTVGDPYPPEGYFFCVDKDGFMINQETGLKEEFTDGTEPDKKYIIIPATSYNSIINREVQDKDIKNIL